MRLVSYHHLGQEILGVVASDDTISPISELAPGLPGDTLALIAAGPAAWARIEREAKVARGGGMPIADASLLAPIPRPRRGIFCVGLNYADHFEEGRLRRGASAPSEMPEWPAFFTKGPQTVTGHDSPVWHPSPHSDQLDWEIELAVIIGKSGVDIAEKDALDHVFGYTVANDLSVRDVQRRHGGQWWKGKNFDSHLPLGPCIVTAAELDEPYDLRLALRVNGVVKQDSNTRLMYFKIPRLIHDLSIGMELAAGDVVLTGTPRGVGVYREPPEFLRVGDVVEGEIERIGTLRNRVMSRVLSAGHSGSAAASGGGAAARVIAGEGSALS